MTDNRHEKLSWHSCCTYFSADCSLVVPKALNIKNSSLPASFFSNRDTCCHGNKKKQKELQILGFKSLCAYREEKEGARERRNRANTFCKRNLVLAAELTTAQDRAVWISLFASSLGKKNQSLGGKKNSNAWIGGRERGGGGGGGYCSYVTYIWNEH